MSIEGMWTFQSASAGAPDRLEWGGIVILESNRVFGGDSMQAYTGTYSVDRGNLRAEVRTWTWNKAIQSGSVFGMEGPVDMQVICEGAIGDREMSGFVYPADQPDLKLAARMEKISELP